MTDVRTIDVSRWQGWIDWNAVRDSGCAGAWIKCGGADGGRYADSQWATNRANAAGAGLPFGSYYFASPAPGDGPGQAQHAVGLGMGAADQTLAPVLDIEHNPHGLGSAELDDFAEAFCVEVERLTGVRPAAVYSGAYFGVGYNAGHPIGRRPFWVANYGSNTPSFEPPPFEPAVPAAWADTGWSAWQFNSTTMQPGITDNTCDQNTVTAEAWAAMTGDETEEDEMATRSVVRTKAGSQWAKERLGVSEISEAYWTLVEGAATARYLWSWDLVTQECFWLGIDPADTWLVDDSFMIQRYHYEVEDVTGGAATAAASTPAAIAATFAVVLVALLWVALELGLRADWYELTQWQIAGCVGLVVIVCALVATFVRAHGVNIMRRVGGPAREAAGDTR